MEVLEITIEILGREDCRYKRVAGDDDAPDDLTPKEYKSWVDNFMTGARAKSRQGQPAGEDMEESGTVVDIGHGAQHVLRNRSGRKGK